MVSRGSSAQQSCDRTRYELAHSAGHRSPGHQVDASSVSIHRLPSNRSLADGCCAARATLPKRLGMCDGYIAWAIIAWCAYIRTRQRSICPKGGPVNSAESDQTVPGHGAITKWDPGLTEKVIGLIRPLIKGWHRSEVRGLEKIPPGAALVVSNHSGGIFAMDVPVLATDYYERYGYNRPIVTLGFDLLFVGPTADFFRRTGFIPASRRNADEALRSGGLVVVFPGGDYDIYRPSFARNKIDFGGRNGYVEAALNAGVPIVPLVGIGGQENQLYLTRGTEVAKLLRLDKLLRSKVFPISFGFPFGLSAVIPVNVPLPTKIVMQVLEPIDVVAEFGEDPKVDEVDAHIRRVMQRALEELARERRLPVIG